LFDLLDPFFRPASAGDPTRAEYLTNHEPHHSKATVHATITDPHKAINSKFAAAGISIVFPQRDIHLDAQSPLRVRIEGIDARS
jgi:hypothetical protein